MSVLERLTTALLELTICVGRRDPFQSTSHRPQKFWPVIVTERAGPPAMALLGESVVRTGVPELVCAATKIETLHKKTNQKKNRETFFTGASPKRGNGAAGCGEHFH